ncbi:7TM diverse intracellular signaling domain-containing protein [Thermonema rossianum]|uniref:7TM diverse intracellular signaling domain-containing protein n=1 Tax=Thermonema rossianum TaxID=55505 RepID=UPI000570D3A6|nr:7TM diverse intracellular signaling domain-containing protein [Thermonema rossianum]
MIQRTLLFSLLFFTFCFGSHARQETVATLRDDSRTIDVSSYFSYWIDESGHASLEDVMQADQKGQFQKHAKKVINLGFLDKPVWLKLQLSNQAQRTKEWLLELNYPLLDSITLYQQDEAGRWLSETIGDQVPFDRREIHFRNPTFPLYLYDNSRVYTIYIRVKTSSSVQLPAKIYTSNAFQEYTIKSDLAFGFFYGCMLVMLFYNLLLFAALRNLNYAYYCVYVIGYTLAQAGLQGHGFQYLWPNSLFWTNVSIPVLISLGLIGAVLFANRFLYTKRYAPRMRIVLWVLFGINVLNILLSFFLPYQTMIKPVVLSIIVDSVLIIAAGIVVYRAGNKAAQYFIIAWLAFLLGLIATASEAFGLLPRTFIFHYGHLFGAVIEVVFLSLALADRINVIRKQREEAQARALAMAQENERIIREQNIILEQKVRERTAELQQKQEEILTQNEELQQQREEILAQRDFIERQNQELQAINEHLNKSIQYGDRIQRAMLPSKEEILQYVRDFFVIYLPRDVVSGDFYWFSEREGHLFFAAVDCTGHGVPGAFMSMIGNTLLDEIINEKHLYNPAFILEALNDAVFKALRQDETGNADGMDVALCRIDKIDEETFELTFAGARRPAYVVKDGALVELKGNRRGIGGSMSQKLEQFENHQLILHANDCIYIGSDGFTDAANPEREKFGTKRLKTLLQLYYKEPMERQRQYLIEELENFTKGTPMRDDVLLMGIRL